MKEIINNSGADLVTSKGTIKNGQTGELSGKELETCLKLKGVKLLDSIKSDSKKSKKNK